MMPPPPDAAALARLTAIVTKPQAAWSISDTLDVLTAAPALVAGCEDRNHAEHARLKAGTAMWALWDYLKGLGHPFESWPDAVRNDVSAALIDDRPLTEDEIKWAREHLAALDAAREEP